ncbi:hypothetical protein XCCB100_2465 [Xanthomonas campestris pv. campestris]|uniref:Uncharacterized protein n=1 Tax=Xanthomonas campestris pv. campestris (strain B100) TaxID=509169 RepID=B0RTR1_XANCB|nr:hypothetical protein XCCB100_2465 [Xanthomonas campestris pv. campestris]
MYLILGHAPIKFSNIFEACPYLTQLCVARG